MPKKRIIEEDVEEEKTDLSGVEKFLDEEVKEPQKTEEELKAEETKKVEEEAIKKETEEKPLDIDTSALKEEITKEVKEEIVSKLKGTEEEKKDAYDKFAATIWEKENRQPTWKEALGFLKDELKAEEKTAQEAKTQEEEKAKATAEEQTKNLNEMWDKELADLEEQGLIPKVEDKEDKNDAGVKARRELFEMGTQLLAEKKITYPSLKLAYYEGYAKKSRQPAGATAPIVNGRKSVNVNANEDYTYDELHNSTFDELAHNENV